MRTQKSCFVTFQVLKDSCPVGGDLFGELFGVGGPAPDIAGGFQELDVNDASVGPVLDFFLKFTNRHSGSLSLVKVEYQAVAGINYRLTFMVSYLGI